MEGKTCAAVDFYYYLLAFDYYDCYCYHYDDVAAAAAAVVVGVVAVGMDDIAGPVAAGVAAVGDNVAAGLYYYWYWLHLPRCLNAGGSSHQPRNHNHWNLHHRAAIYNFLIEIFYLLI